MKTAPRSIARSRYQALAEVRYQIRRFLNFSERAARAAALEPHQHQLLLALKGLPKNNRPTVGALAERLQIRHHSAVELIDRLERRGMVKRARGSLDRRQVFVSITKRGEGVLRRLSLTHLAELRSRAPAFLHALESLLAGPDRSRTAGSRFRQPCAAARRTQEGM